MSPPAKNQNISGAALRKLAMSLPDTEEGIACAGTALEKRTIKVKKRAFLFLGTKDVMFKLGPSLAEATKLAARQPDGCKVGASGWVTLTLTLDSPPPQGTLNRWIEESYRLMAPPATATRAKSTAKPAPKAATSMTAAKKRSSK